jgi:hypothetical protein
MCFFSGGWRGEVGLHTARLYKDKACIMHGSGPFEPLHEGTHAGAGVRSLAFNVQRVASIHIRIPPPESKHCASPIVFIDGRAVAETLLDKFLALVSPGVLLSSLLSTPHGSHRSGVRNCFTNYSHFLLKHASLPLRRHSMP